MSVHSTVVKIVYLHALRYMRRSAAREEVVGLSVSLATSLSVKGKPIIVSKVLLVPPTKRMIEVPLRLFSPDLRELRVVTRSPR